ncbi:MAG TPA: GatB/YqeY domain-containing protein, partial [Armatimonadota bacterium]|nr:GatB/YqeY domain-containing protein [Armatimonadota bacterium]
MSLKDTLQENMKSAMKARDELKTSTIRLALSAVKNMEIDKGREATDEEITEVLTREVKRRREAIEGAEKAGRSDVADRERGELEILSVFLPKQLGEDEIELIVREVIAEVGAAGPKDR